MSSLRVIAKGIGLISLLAAVGLSLINITSANTPEKAEAENSGITYFESQIGFYDMLSKKEEVYDVHLYPGAQVLLANITDPNDSRFIIKGKMLRDPQNDGNNSYKFTSVYYYNPIPDQLIDSVLDSSKQNSLLFRNYPTNEDQLMVAQNGLMFLYPKSAKAHNLSKPQAVNTPQKQQMAVENREEK